MQTADIAILTETWLNFHIASPGQDKDRRKLYSLRALKQTSSGKGPDSALAKAPETVGDPSPKPEVQNQPSSKIKAENQPII